ncbi:HNH endonuclease [Kitasatospora aureofaciens]|uniref:HNH endonuclease n=1 Tax=Kitasatospora aureofaciens TaxID=1894 RepID=UPI001D6B4280|nr:HNH endonuclease [Kitasatospora aureofaciens]HJD84147.1 hypothetical protein [Kitasatospora aureofaciens]
MTAWAVLAVQERKRAGSGYDDQPSTHYSWDSTVPNARNLQVGDPIVLWDRETLLGMSVIEAIEVGDGEKDTPFCPFCKLANVAPRKTLTPVYKCWKCRKEFDEPGWTHKVIKTYRSRHEAGWIDLRGVLTASQVRKLCVSEDSQHAMRELRWDDFNTALAETGTPTPLDIIETTREVIAGGHRKATVRVRIGQPAFRKALLAEFGEICAFTGPVPAQALDAAHLYSYAANGKHHKGGGLLLRRDLHRLFDLGFLAVNPATGTLDVAGSLAGFPDYANLHGKQVTVSLTADRVKWLAKHWAMHRGD